MEDFAHAAQIETEVVEGGKLGPAGVAELAQGFGLDLAHPLPGDVELPAQLFQRPGAAILQTEAEGECCSFWR